MKDCRLSPSFAVGNGPLWPVFRGVIAASAAPDHERKTMAENMPKNPPPPPKYLSEVPSRSYQAGGTYKHHRNIGHAKSAILATGSWSYGYRGGKIWEWNQDTREWELLYEVPSGTKQAELPWLTQD